MLTIWCLVIGLLLIGMGLTDTMRRDLPFSASALYLLAGWLIGPEIGGLLQLELFGDARLIEMLTEVAVLISLFAVGLRLRVRLTDRLWLTPLLLATVAMVSTIGALTAIGLAMGLSIGAAMLLAAVLSPTDPVLASEVQVDNPDDRDRLRFGLSGEGGLNDGTAFPFVMLALGLLGLHDLGAGGWRWWGIDLLWAVSGALVLGWAMGWAFSRIVLHLRREREQAFGMESFLTLGLIALTYGLSLTVQTYGFLAVFAAGLAMRSVEYTDSDGKARAPRDASPKTSAYMARVVLDFALDIERLAELAVMLLVGSLLRAEVFGWASLGIAALLLLVVRPLAVRLTLLGSDLTPTQRRLAAWFGIRGVGSIYYLAFAISHGVVGAQMTWIAHAVLATVVASVVLHGASATPAMRLYRRARGTHERAGR
ncbi:MAG TPA: cation:proton antiporter [Burkholderiaceae bacterium]|nr:cation:proton antiporter [Burkholderiaceae bacterium]